MGRQLPHYDAIVLGVGGMGSATLYHLAQRGLRVLGIERYDIPNDMGSSHGITRIIRLAYYEHLSYVPLLKRAYELWRQLQDMFGEQLLFTTGSLDIGRQGSQVFEGSRSSCELHNLPHEILSGEQVNERFPGYHLPDDLMALFQPDGGFLLPERCIVAHVTGAVGMGAEVHGREEVLEWRPVASGIEVTTDRSTYLTDKLVVCAGAWTGKLVPELSGLLAAERQVLGWFQPLQASSFSLDNFPVFNMLVDEGKFYGFPAYGIPGFKVGRFHHLYQQVDPDTMDRDVQKEDEEVLRVFTDRYFPDASGPAMSLKT